MPLAAGAFDVYVQPFPATGVKTPVTQEGRNTPVWSRRNELLYVTPGSSELFARSISGGAALTFGSERVLPVRGFLNVTTNGYRGYDLSDDGDGLVMLFPAEDSGGDANLRINVVVNWHEELKQRVPVRGR